jgi:predicted alpha/beta hydrolase
MSDAATSSASWVAKPVRFQAVDGYPLGGFLWSGGGCAKVERPVVIITSATSVRCRYYARFATYLHAHGYDVLTFDYRGIGESRPASLRSFRADWADWGEKDVEGALCFAADHFGERATHIVAHSIGGFALGLAPSARRVRRIVTVGAQYAFWRDYGRNQRLTMLWKWHVVMPLLTRIFGYFPAKRLGWMEDTPAGVVHDWSRMGAHFEDTIRAGRMSDGQQESELLRERLLQVTAEILAISLTDDPHGTVTAVNRLLAYFGSAKRRHLQVRPQDIGHDHIGHFAFFHDRFRDTLWPLALYWLRHGTVPDGLSKSLVAPDH